MGRVSPPRQSSFDHCRAGVVVCTRSSQSISQFHQLRSLKTHVLQLWLMMSSCWFVMSMSFLSTCWDVGSVEHISYYILMSTKHKLHQPNGVVCYYFRCSFYTVTTSAAGLACASRLPRTRSSPSKHRDVGVAAWYSWHIVTLWCNRRCDSYNSAVWRGYGPVVCVVSDGVFSVHVYVNEL